MTWLKSNKLSDQDRIDLARDASRSARVSNFLNSDFWVKDFSPYLKEEEEKSSRCPWHPSKDAVVMTCEAIALQTAFNNGMRIMAHKIREDLSIWLEKGQSAAEEIKRDNARKEASV